ncbi:ATP-binding cassette domain-containing protein [Anaerosporobacter sp.]|uniref:ATP-binding cassette domain-containing protein n=1 Tax=Anaerosporobacter sp. TaxID=1872529 RepID=UPI00286EE52A|nr:ATP-binding cassette domain-containing protein [Anaerosporobacter sp.]
MQYVLKTNLLTKKIGDKELVSNVNIHIKKGEIYGFLGPNGAGKTTIMRMITNLWKPSSGDIEIFNTTLTPTSYPLLKRIGSIIEFPVFFNHLTGAENLQLHCEYLGYYISDGVKNILNLLELSDAADVPVQNYSLGMRQRLGIARAILSKPELLILDEPTNGLDPAGMKQIRDLLKMLCQEYGITIMISSHILSEIENIADTIGVLNHGKLIKEISMEDISDMNLAYIELVVDNSNKAAYVLSEKMKLNNFKVLEGNVIRIYENSISPQDISKTLSANSVSIEALGRKSDSLEDYFLKLTEETT